MKNDHRSFSSPLYMTDFWARCVEHADVCRTGVVIGIILVIIILLIYRTTSEHLIISDQLIQSVYGPNAAVAAILRGWEIRDPSVSRLSAR